MNKKEVRVEKPSISGLVVLVVGIIAAALIVFLVVSQMYNHGLPRDPLKKPAAVTDIGKPGRGN